MHCEGDSSQSLVAGLVVNLPQCKVETSVVGDCHEVASSLTDKHEVLGKYPLPLFFLTLVPCHLKTP